MASDKQTVAYLVEQLGLAGEIRAKPMFGEYGVYCDGVFCAFVCDDQLFIKAAPAGAAFLDEGHLASPYPGGKPAYRVPADRWDDRDWLAALLRPTVAALASAPVEPRKRSKARPS